MNAREELKKIYPNCTLYKSQYFFGKITYIVFSDVDNEMTLGIGNTPKNAYNNALNNYNKQKQ